MRARPTTWPIFTNRTADPRDASATPPRDVASWTAAPTRRCLSYPVVKRRLVLEPTTFHDARGLVVLFLSHVSADGLLVVLRVGQGVPVHELVVRVVVDLVVSRAPLLVLVNPFQLSVRATKGPLEVLLGGVRRRRPDPCAEITRLVLIPLLASLEFVAT